MQQDPGLFASTENKSSRESFSTSSGSQSPPASFSPYPSGDSQNNKYVKSLQERRREQNRISQRAFRDRKDKLLKTLETEIAQWQAKHKRLCENYSSQSADVRRLNARIEELTSKIAALQTVLSARSPTAFDLVPVFD